MRASFVFLLAVISLGSVAEARVFDLTKESLAAYFGGSFGGCAVGDTAYSGSSGQGTQLDKSVQTAASGEVGVVLSGTRFNLKLGAEYLMPRSLQGIVGTDSGGTQLFSLNSDIAAFIPEASFEYMAYRGPTSRLLLGLGYGWAIVSLDNQYTMTSAGQSKFNTGSYTESSKTSAPMLQAYFGYEFTFTDTVTATLTAGYRALRPTTFKLLKDTNAISGSEPSGSDLRNQDGGIRTLDLGGPFAGLNFRFYFWL